jgi:hypothetical protein
MIRPLLLFVSVVSTISCQRESVRNPAATAKAPSCVVTLQQATRIGEAILHVRAARVYASTNQQRAALVELEGMLRNSIATVADSAWQALARSKAADSFFTLPAESMRRGIDEAAANARTNSERNAVEAALLRGYGEHLQEVALGTSGDNASPCMDEVFGRVNRAVVETLRSK